MPDVVQNLQNIRNQLLGAFSEFRHPFFVQNVGKIVPELFRLLMEIDKTDFPRLAPAFYELVVNPSDIERQKVA